MRAQGPQATTQQPARPTTQLVDALGRQPPATSHAADRQTAVEQQADQLAHAVRIARPHQLQLDDGALHTTSKLMLLDV